MGSWNNIVAIDVAAHSGTVIALKSDGTLVSNGEGFNGEGNYPGYDSTDEYNEVVSWTNIVKVLAGFGYGANCIFGLKDDGTVVAVGTNEHGQCNVLDWTDNIDISAGEFFCLGLKSDGSILLSGAEFGNADYMKEEKETITKDWTNIRIPGVNISKIEKVEDAYIDTSFFLKLITYWLEKDTFLQQTIILFKREEARGITMML